VGPATALDLGGNTRFLLTLIESGVEVLFADLPEVRGATGRLILMQIAAIAELEAGLTSERKGCWRRRSSAVSGLV
jgi:hypothetical protein